MSAQKVTRDRNLKHPVFQACRDLEPIPFWKSFFDSCSFGQFPKGLIFQNDTLSYRKAKKKPAITCYVPSEPTEALRVVKYFVRNEVGVISVDEITEKRVEMNIALRKNILPADTTWRDIRAPTVKQQMIALFCFKMMEACELTHAETNHLFITINIGLICETITGDDIVLVDGGINEIHGLYRDEFGFFTQRIPLLPKMTMNRVEHRTKQIHSAKNWPKLKQQYAAYIGVK